MSVMNLPLSYKVDLQKSLRSLEVKEAELRESKASLREKEAELKVRCHVIHSRLPLSCNRIEKWQRLVPRLPFEGKGGAWECGTMF